MDIVTVSADPLTYSTHKGYHILDTSCTQRIMRGQSLRSVAALALLLVAIVSVRPFLYFGVLWHDHSVSCLHL